MYTKASPNTVFLGLLASLASFFNKNPLLFVVNCPCLILELLTRPIASRHEAKSTLLIYLIKFRKKSTKSEIQNGIAHVFAPHATGILVLTENDPALLEDIRGFLEDLAAKQANYAHPSNAHSHLRSLLFPPDKTLPIVNGRVEFGTWQSLLFVETDVYPRERTIIIQVIGES